MSGYQLEGREKGGEGQETSKTTFRLNLALCAGRGRERGRALKTNPRKWPHEAEEG